MPANESANKAYYGSGQKSVIRNNNPVSRVGQHNDPVQANVSSAEHVAGDTSTDKYYNNGGSKMQQRARAAAPFVPVDPRADSKARPAAGAAYKTRGEGDLRRPLIVSEGSPAAIRAAVDRVVELLINGTSPVLVQVTEAGFETDIRTGLDIRVAREIITRDQYRDVQFAMAPRNATELADRAFGKIDPKALPEVKVGEDEEDKLPEDFAEFVNSGDDNDTTEEKSRVVSTRELPTAPADDTDDDVPDAPAAAAVETGPVGPIGHQGPEGPAGSSAINSSAIDDMLTEDAENERAALDIAAGETKQETAEETLEEPGTAVTVEEETETDDDTTTADETPAAPQAGNTPRKSKGARRR